MSAPATVQLDYMAYIKSFFIGGVVGLLFYKVVDLADVKDMIPSGGPTVFISSGLGAIAGPYVLSMLPMGLVG